MSILRLFVIMVVLKSWRKNIPCWSRFVILLEWFYIFVWFNGRLKIEKGQRQMFSNIFISIYIILLLYYIILGAKQWRSR